MPSRTLSRFSICRLLAVLVASGGLASGCQSSRPSFSFQPVVLRAVAPRPIAPKAIAATSAPAATVVLPAPAVAQQQPAKPTTAAAVESPAPAAAQPQPAQMQRLATATTPAVAAQAAASTRSFAPLRRHLLQRAHAPARQGLGLTVLGLLGMVALVVALVGLAISGGGAGWIIAAAVAAGVVLLAYLDPGGH